MCRQIILKHKRDESLKRFHPWIFSGAVAKYTDKPDEGDVVDILTADNEFIARGHYQTGSIICRVLTFENEKIDTDFWRKRISNAYKLREKAGLVNNKYTTAYRLVHGEGDMLPGLIIDIYGKTAVIQAHSTGMFYQRQTVCEILIEIFGNKLDAVYDKSSATIPFNTDSNIKDGYIFGSNDENENIILENGNKFIVNPEIGQKTGFFIDQRENRKILEQYTCKTNVLNTFCYTGGFSVSAFRGGANLVHSVDSSQKAIDFAYKNIELNFGKNINHQAFVDDTFSFMRNAENNFYDVIILDPPAFAKHNSALKNAMQAYKRLNAAALAKIKSSGILFTFSCSQAVDRTNFRNAVFSAAAISRRNVRILHQLTQPADHPVNIYHPEGEYLKGLVLYVE
ncbi:MAG: class I SAM-dependent rRNA methyltransferase [Prevotellaceae bacterium]|jgi:23S rRNA (cytosine1962-C5)-methyltransferase|nr:class I SAM-dependent rRNA methyltransferase [Prevotellaceae bacterium]